MSATSAEPGRRCVESLPAACYTVSQQFFFDAAHSLQREIETLSSRRIHGHTYHAVVQIQGDKNPDTGMVIDLGRVRQRIAAVRERLDHHLLDDVDGLGAPTLENLCQFIWLALQPNLPGLCSVTVRREGIGDACTLSRK